MCVFARLARDRRFRVLSGPAPPASANNADLSPRERHPVRSASRRRRETEKRGEGGLTYQLSCPLAGPHSTGTPLPTPRPGNSGSHGRDAPVGVGWPQGPGRFGRAVARGARAVVREAWSAAIAVALCCGRPDLAPNGAGRGRGCTIRAARDPSYTGVSADSPAAGRQALQFPVAVDPLRPRPCRKESRGPRRGVAP